MKDNDKSIYCDMCNNLIITDNYVKLNCKHNYHTCCFYNINQIIECNICQERIKYSIYKYNKLDKLDLLYLYMYIIFILNINNIIYINFPNI